MTDLVDRAPLYLFLALSVLVVAFVPLLILVLLKDRSKSRYDQQRKEVALSAMRNTYESQIAELAMRLTATEERWQEVNHLIVSSQAVQPQITAPIDPERIPLLAELNIKKDEIPLSENLVFVLTPFADSEDKTFRSIKFACERKGLECVRGDETYAAGEVLPHIIRLMCRASIVIANVSSRNPNVFYELGIAHAIGKTTILVGQSIEEVPFDVKTKRVVTFHNSVQLEERLGLALAHELGLPTGRIGGGKEIDP